MSKTRHYRPEERSIDRGKPVAEKATKYKKIIIQDDDDLDEEEQAYYAELNAPDYTEF